MTETQLPQAIRSAELDVAGIKLTVHVLDNGMRVIEKNSMDQLFEKMNSGLLTPAQADEIAKAVGRA